MWGFVQYAHKAKPNSPFVYICATIESGALISRKGITREKLRAHKKEFLQDIIEAAQRELRKLDSQ